MAEAQRYVGQDFLMGQSFYVFKYRHEQTGRWDEWLILHQESQADNSTWKISFVRRTRGGHLAWDSQGHAVTQNFRDVVLRDFRCTTGARVQPDLHFALASGIYRGPSRSMVYVAEITPTGMVVMSDMVRGFRRPQHLLVCGLLIEQVLPFFSELYPTMRWQFEGEGDWIYIVG